MGYWHIRLRDLKNTIRSINKAVHNSHTYPLFVVLRGLLTIVTYILYS